MRLGPASVRNDPCGTRLRWVKAFLAADGWCAAADVHPVELDLLSPHANRTYFILQLAPEIVLPSVGSVIL